MHLVYHLNAMSHVEHPTEHRDENKHRAPQHFFACKNVLYRKKERIPEG